MSNRNMFAHSLKVENCNIGGDLSHKYFPLFCRNVKALISHIIIDN